MLSGIGVSFVGDLTPIEAVLQHQIEGTTREFLTTIRAANNPDEYGGSNTRWCRPGGRHSLCAVLAETMPKSETADTLSQPLTRNECDVAGMTWNDKANVCGEKSGVV